MFASAPGVALHRGNEYDFSHALPASFRDGQSFVQVSMNGRSCGLQMLERTECQCRESFRRSSSDTGYRLLGVSTSAVNSRTKSSVGSEETHWRTSQAAASPISFSLWRFSQARFIASSSSSTVGAFARKPLM